VGAEIQTEHFTEADHARFKDRLDKHLRALDEVLHRPGFGVAPRTLGAELELCLVDADGRACAISEQLVREANTPAITPEMGAFDIELSTPPVALAGAPFSALRESMQTTVRHIRELAEGHGLGVIREALRSCMDDGRIRTQPVDTLAHVYMAMLLEAATLVAEGRDRTEVAAVLDDLLESL